MVPANPRVQPLSAVGAPAGCQGPSGGSSTDTTTYDADGNLITKTNISTGVELEYTWDYRNRLTEVQQVSGGATTTVAQYTYDAMGRRIEESYAGGSTNYLYYNSAWQVIEERQGGTSSSDVHYQYVMGASGELVLRDTYSSGSIVTADRLNALWDANGDVTAITNSSGTVEERDEYSPYGAVTVLTASGSPVTGNVSAYGWQYLFHGGRQDAATGLYIFEHRDYNPGSGTWMERDPLGLAAGDENLSLFV
jgi:RHS repeat-associated protein